MKCAMAPDRRGHCWQAPANRRAARPQPGPWGRKVRQGADEAASGGRPDTAVGEVRMCDHPNGTLVGKTGNVRLLTNFGLRRRPHRRPGLDLPGGREIVALPMHFNTGLLVSVALTIDPCNGPGAADDKPWRAMPAHASHEQFQCCRQTHHIDSNPNHRSCDAVLTSSPSGSGLRPLAPTGPKSAA